jgi:small subunit ribosomal protein S6
VRQIFYHYSDDCGKILHWLAEYSAAFPLQASPTVNSRGNPVERRIPEMRTYEVVLIVNPELDETAFKAVIEKVQGWITTAGGTVEKLDIWGKRRLAYVIGKHRDGQYALITANFAPVFANDLERQLRFLEPVFRFMITVVE